LAESEALGDNAHFTDGPIESHLEDCLDWTLAELGFKKPAFDQQ
jgi:hypothetical protein